jgi:2-hydroxychromene-2-carboxylate isomerase
VGGGFLHTSPGDEAALAAASSPEIKQVLRAQNEEAVARGLFGAPSFTVRDEMFWGNDQLEEALAWATRV